MKALRFIGMLIVLVTLSMVTLEGNSQTYNSYTPTDSFKVEGVFYRLPTFTENDTKSKFLGYVKATIIQTKNGFRMIKINGNAIKRDSSIDLLQNQSAQVTECVFSDNYLFQAHYRKNGLSYVVMFNSDRIRDYYISH